jgi:SAM-dependent methyltransferase
MTVNPSPERPIRPGVMMIGDYQETLSSPLFRRMEVFSNHWLAANSAALAPYARKWVPDSLHHWSRQWEYPFVFSQLAAHVVAQPRPCRILDAGSGVTFFPHFLQAEIPGSKVVCCDYDESFINIFDKLNRKSDTPVQFDALDMRRLPYPSASFEAVICVSVLEHTSDYTAILREFARVLAPGGLFVGTFDVCLDGQTDISPEEAQQLLATAQATFPQGDNIDILKSLNDINLLTTDYIRREAPGLLTWRRPPIRVVLGQLRRGRWIGLGRSFFRMTCCGVTLRN